MIVALSPLLVGLGSIPIVLFIRTINDKRNSKKNWKAHYYLDLNSKKWFPSFTFSVDEAKRIHSQDVITMPQLTFDRWLVLYNNKPECWTIQTNEKLSWCNIPYYTKVTEHKYKNEVKKDISIIPIFWKSPEEMKKYRDWVEKEYEFGNAQIFENIRNNQLKELTNYISDDIAARRKELEKEVNEARKEISLKFSDGTEVKIGPAGMEVNSQFEKMK